MDVTKIRSLTKPLIICITFLWPFLALAETRAERDARMEWFREARFGMFIHWGLYAIPAGEWKGQKHTRNAEWIQSFSQIPQSEYQMLKDQFNPTKYDADAWVRLAKQAGMKYIVLTSKHHDGFGLWDSEETDWDVGSTPWGKDLIKPLAEACEKYGLKLCFYYSILDWHHPDWGIRAPWRGNADNPKPEMDRYTAYLKAQLKELLSNYGEIGILWFDGEWEDAWTHERAVDLDEYLRSLQPSLIINNRIDKGRGGYGGFSKGEDLRGDYGTPEQQVPATGFEGVDWETCMTMNETWGYSAHDEAWKSAKLLTRQLIDTASKGGNYLLNIGPTAEGKFPTASIERLEEIGQWMKENGESIYGTQANPFPRTPWGRCTVKEQGEDSRLYLHIFYPPEKGQLRLLGLRNEIKGAHFLASVDTALEVSKEETEPVIILPSNLPDHTATVVVVDLVGKPEIDAAAWPNIKPEPIVLRAEEADFGNGTFTLQKEQGGSWIGNWKKLDDTLQFPVNFSATAIRKLSLRAACGKGGGGLYEIRFRNAADEIESTLRTNIRPTDDWSTFEEQKIGALEIPAGPGVIEIAPLNINEGGLMNFSSLSL